MFLQTMDTTMLIALAVGAVVFFCLGFAAGRWLLSRRRRHDLDQARTEAERLLEDARTEAEALREKELKEVQVELERRQSAIDAEQSEARRMLKRTRQVLEERQQNLANRLEETEAREQTLQRAADALDALQREAEQDRQQARRLQQRAAELLELTKKRDEETASLERTLEARAQTLQKRREHLQEMIEEHTRKLERVSGMTRKEALEALKEQLVEEARLEAAAHIKEVRDEARVKANREARKVVLTAIQRTAANHSIENTVSVVNIPSDEMKGRIIGREGRNIRTFEAETGIEVIVDDTPEAVILSGFDPIRREVARIAMVRLIQDGRIHPGRIEEVIEKAREDVEDELIETGERTAIELNLHGLHPELIHLVGRMRYRTSYGQNLLGHSIETARIASLMAAELGLDASKARRAGLLHDIGKVVEEELEQPHALVGMERCRKYGEDEEVCNAVGAHHDEIEMTTPLSPIVQAADAVSGARPGARREALEAYIKRLEDLESLAASFEGVERVYAIQAGRELRVIVNHDLVSDAHAEQLAVDISQQIEDKMRYPGQIKVTVIREKRATSYAK